MMRQLKSERSQRRGLNLLRKVGGGGIIAGKIFDEKL